MRARTLHWAAALAVATLAFPASGASPAALKRLFPQEAPLAAEQPGLMRLVLPPAVIKACRPNLSDLRVFDVRGREVAYLVDSHALDEVLEVTESFDSTVRGLRRDVQEPERGPGLYTEIYQIEAPPEDPAEGTWDLVFQVPRGRFVREVTVRQGGAEGSEVVVGGEPLFRLDSRTQRTRFSLPPISRQPLFVEITGKEGAYLEPRFRFESGRRLEPPRAGVVALEELSRERVEGKTVIELARPSGLVPDRLQVETITGSLSRRVSVWDEQPGRADLRIAQGTVYRLAGRQRLSNLRLRLRPARGDSLRVEIEDGDSPPLEDLRFSAIIRRPVLVFELPADARGAVTGTLRFGGGRALRPRYDLTALRLGAGRLLEGLPAEAAVLIHDAAEIPFVTLGELRANPSFDATPALAFAMHAGASLDPRSFSHRRPVFIVPSVEGLSRLRLSPEDTAQARADLGDLRIVDGESRQWPYLMKRDAGSEAVALEPIETESRKRRSRYRLALPVAPLRLDRLELRTDTPFFDRSYRLVTIGANGEERVLSQGRIVKQARKPRPARITFPPQPIDGLELIVEDGDDAPLRFRSLSARVRLPELFLAAPEGPYALLMGHPELPAPHYELERVRDVVLAVKSRHATPGLLEPNPVYSVAARLSTEDGLGGFVKTWLVWGVLLAAVAVLAILTQRVARQEPIPGDTSEGAAPGDDSER